MSKISLTNLVNLQNETTAVNAVNANNSTLVTALDNTLSRDGTQPNTMGANLDMNSNRIINLPSAVSTSEPVTLAQMNAAILPTGLTGVPVSAAMQPVVNSSTVAIARTLLQVPTPYIDATLYGVVADGVTDNSTALQAAITAAAGQMVQLPVGTIVLKSQVHYITTTAFAPGLHLRGWGQELTIIDNQVSNNSCIYTAGGISNPQLGSYIGNFTITTTTNPASSHGIEHFSVYQGVVENIEVKNLTGDGMRITANLGDSDASNNIQYRMCRFNNCNNGHNCNFFTSAVQTSFLRFDSCFWNECNIGMRWSGAYCLVIGGGFTESHTYALNIYNNTVSNDMFQMIGVSFENNTQNIQCDSLQGGTFIGCEFASGSVIPSSLSTVLNNTLNVRFSDSRIRVTSTPYTLWTLGASSTGNIIQNSYYQSYDLSGQIRYSVPTTAFANRIDDSFDSIQVGQTNGLYAVICVNGSNENVPLLITGAMLAIGGPTSSFSIGGFANGFDGRRVTMWNSSGQVLTLNSEDASSTAANRIKMDNNSNVTINPNGSFVLVYENENQRWHLVGHG